MIKKRQFVHCVSSISISFNVIVTFMATVSIFVLIASALAVKSFLISDSVQRVQTQYGEIDGTLVNVEFDGRMYQVKKFLGIPYAEPPVEKLRFEKTVPVKNISTPFLANTFGPNCPQTSETPGAGRMSEDCLYLNIFVPANKQVGMSSKPVMVYFHGGGFVLGSADIYEADVLSTYTDVIIVTINYRLGPLGFFSTHDQNAAGNYGLWDQHVAVKWVRENIAAFGGDTADMTIFGQSAGSSSVVYQMMYPGNKGLYQRAIAVSGTIAAWAYNNKGVNYNASLKFAESVGCNDTSHANIMSCLRSKGSDDITKAAASYDYYGYNIDNPEWVPVFDGDFIITEPADILTEISNTSYFSKYEHFYETDLIIGATNQDGYTFFRGWMAELNFPMDLISYNPFVLNVTEHEFKDIFVPRATQVWFKEPPSDSVNAVVEFEYTNLNDPSNNALSIHNIIDMCTDFTLNAPIAATAQAHVEKNSNTYVYQFSTSLPDSRLPPHTSRHAEDLVYAFGMTPPLMRIFNVTMADFTADEIKVSKAVMTMWTNFAKSGNPNKPTNIRPLFDVEWHEYGTSQRYLEVTPEMTQDSVKSRLHARAVHMWNKLLPKLQSQASTCRT